MGLVSTFMELRQDTLELLWDWKSQARCVLEDVNSLIAEIEENDRGAKRADIEVSSNCESTRNMEAYGANWIIKAIE